MTMGAVKSKNVSMFQGRVSEKIVRPKYMEEDISWQTEAACHGHDPELWFPVGTKADPRALRICLGCPVREACLEYALPKRLNGIWGGFTEEGRHSLTRKRRRRSCANCRSYAVETDEPNKTQLCLACGLSWLY